MSYKYCQIVKGEQFCVVVGPIIFVPQLPPWDSRGESEGQGYPGIANDLALLASVHNLANGISDQSTQKAVRIGLQSALAAVQKRGAEHGLSVSEIKQGEAATA